MMDKMFFYMPRRFMNYQPKQYFVRNLFSNIMAVFLIVGASFIITHDLFTDLIIILGVIITKLIFDLVVKKKLLKIDI